MAVLFGHLYRRSPYPVFDPRHTYRQRSNAFVPLGRALKRHPNAAVPLGHNPLGGSLTH